VNDSSKVALITGITGQDGSIGRTASEKNYVARHRAAHNNLLRSRIHLRRDEKFIVAACFSIMAIFPTARL
jgi:GDP-D-mannose dehydratase